MMNLDLFMSILSYTMVQRARGLGEIITEYKQSRLELQKNLGGMPTRAVWEDQPPWDHAQGGAWSIPKHLPFHAPGQKGLWCFIVHTIPQQDALGAKRFEKA